MDEIGTITPTLKLVKPPVGAGLPSLNDTCSCFKEPGCYGREGWHLRRYTERDVEIEAGKAAASLPASADHHERQLVETTARGLYARYVGIPFAYERCPAYMAEVERQINERKAQRMADEEKQRRGKRKTRAAEVMGDDL